MKSIKGLENQRWFIWTIVAIIVILGGTATYVWYVGQTDDWGVSDSIVNPAAIHKVQLMLPERQNMASTSPESLNPCGPFKDDVNMQVINTNASWQGSQVIYSLSEVYLTPSVADIGCGNGPQGSGNSSFLALPVKVTTNLNATIPAGENWIDAFDYGSDDIARIINSDGTFMNGDDLGFIVGPGETKTINVVIPVPVGQTSFDVLFGNPADPSSNIEKLHFDFSEAKIHNGVFLINGGYYSQYPSR